MDNPHLRSSPACPALTQVTVQWQARRERPQQPIAEKLKVATEELELLRKRMAEGIAAKERAEEAIRQFESDEGKDESSQSTCFTAQECERANQRSWSHDSATPSKRIMDTAIHPKARCTAVGAGSPALAEGGGEGLSQPMAREMRGGGAR